MRTYCSTCWELKGKILTIAIKQTQNGCTQLAIQNEMTIYTANEQKKMLFEQLKLSNQLQIDLGAVSEIDCAGLQVLMFLKDESKSLHKQVTLIHHSKAVVEAIELLNLSTFLGDPIVISADWKTT